MTQEQLIDVLQELSVASKSISSEAQLVETMHKYDMIFGGDKHNSISSTELYHCIKNIFHIKTSKEELDSMLPNICAKLGKQCDTMILAGKLPERVFAGYQIEL